MYESKEAPWNGSDEGNWWVSIFSDTVLRDGMYTVDLLFDGVNVSSAKMSVGGTPRDPAIFTSSVFALDVDDQGTPIDPVTTIDTSVNRILFFFDYRGMVDGREWNFVWTNDGEVIFESDVTAWDIGDEGTAWVSVFDDQAPLAAGHWVVEIFLDGESVTASNIDVQ